MCISQAQAKKLKVVEHSWINYQENNQYMPSGCFSRQMPRDGARRNLKKDPRFKENDSFIEASSHLIH